MMQPGDRQASRGGARPAVSSRQRPGDRVAEEPDMDCKPETDAWARPPMPLEYRSPQPGTQQRTCRLRKRAHNRAGAPMRQRSGGGGGSARLLDVAMDSALAPIAACLALLAADLAAATGFCHAPAPFLPDKLPAGAPSVQRPRARRQTPRQVTVPPSCVTGAIGRRWQVRHERTRGDLKGQGHGRACRRGRPCCGRGRDVVGHGRRRPCWPSGESLHTL